MKKLPFLMSLLLVITTFSACSEDDGNTNQEARLRINLVDAPGDFDAVLIDVQGVTVKLNSEDESEDLDFDLAMSNPGIYNLLDLTGGNSLLLADEDIPAGKISQIRLLLGDDNSIVVNGVTNPLSTPSAQQSGLKLNVNQEILGGILYEYILDFDASKSIVSQGNGNYSLKPVIKTSLKAASGAISGSVTPSNVQVLVTAKNNGNEINTYTDADGNYVLSGVPSGIYTVTFAPDIDTNLQTLRLENIVVVTGEISNLPDVTLN